MATRTTKSAASGSKAVPPGMRVEHGKVVPHLTVAERVARGKAARSGGAAVEPRRLHPGRATGPTRSRCSRARPHAGARAGADPLRPDAGLAVHVLPRRGADHGRRPGRHARGRGSPRRSAATPT